MGFFDYFKSKNGESEKKSCGYDASHPKPRGIIFFNNESHCEVQASLVPVNSTKVFKQVTIPKRTLADYINEIPDGQYILSLTCKDGWRVVEKNTIDSPFDFHTVYDREGFHASSFGLIISPSLKVTIKTGDPQKTDKKTQINTVNLGPGEKVPKSGKYRCDFCGKGGFAELLSHKLTEAGIDNDKIRELHQMGKLSTIRYFRSGNDFPACPNCGPQTGWTLIEKVSDKNRENGAVIAETCICDVCESPVSWPEGYLVTTTDVVKSYKYWQFFYNTRKNGLRSLGIESYDDFVKDPLNGGKTTSKKIIIGQEKPWLVCRACRIMFNVDAEKARNYAKEWWNSDRAFRLPGTGPAPESAVQYFEQSTASSGTGTAVLKEKGA
jgi:hypothetical protein